MIDGESLKIKSIDTEYHNKALFFLMLKRKKKWKNIR